MRRLQLPVVFCKIRRVGCKGPAGRIFRVGRNPGRPACLLWFSVYDNKLEADASGGLVLSYRGTLKISGILDFGQKYTFTPGVVGCANRRFRLLIQL